MKLHPQDLQKIVRLTLEHYNQRAEEFGEATRDHNVSPIAELHETRRYSSAQFHKPHYKFVMLSRVPGGPPGRHDIDKEIGW
jgi:hypothetical protein